MLSQRVLPAYRRVARMGIVNRRMSSIEKLFSTMEYGVAPEVRAI
jgi:hypothetical protein